MDTSDLIQLIREAFAAVEYPGDHFLLGSTEGSEPAEAIGPFIGMQEWERLDPEILDQHSEALSFLSEGGFRFFLPAFLVADVEGRLQAADPMFHLTHGFTDSSVSIPVGDAVFERAFGRSVMLNPRRFGAMRHYDYARYRLSVFAREEAAAIVAYLEHRRDAGTNGMEGDAIIAALESFWTERARSAPTQHDLAQHVQREETFLRTVTERGLTPEA